MTKLFIQIGNTSICPAAIGLSKLTKKRMKRNSTKSKFTEEKFHFQNSPQKFRASIRVVRVEKSSSIEMMI